MPNKSILLNPSLKNLAEKMQKLSQEDKDIVLMELSACRDETTDGWDGSRKDDFFYFWP